MLRKSLDRLSRRERQIVEVLYRLGHGSVAQIAQEIPDAPSAGALRTLLSIVEGKGYLTSRKDGKRNVYRPKVSRGQAALPAFRQVLKTFFGGSLENAIAAHLADPMAEIDRKELTRLTQLIQKAKKGRR